MEQTVYYITRHGMRLDWEQPDWHVASGTLNAPFQRWLVPRLMGQIVWGWCWWPGEKAYDAPLSKEGLRQAHELGQHLAELDRLDYIFSSPFLRCVQTADAVAAAQEQRNGGCSFTLLRWVCECGGVHADGGVVPSSTHQVRFPYS